MTIFRDLPKDLLEEEILCYVPATCLKRLGSTCKRWNRFFNGDRRFARKHIDKAAKQFLVLVAKSSVICPAIVSLDDGRVPSVEVKSELSLVDSHSKNPVKIDAHGVYHCDGLLLCTSEWDNSKFVVWNPFTGETRWIQPSNPSKGYDFVLGYHQEDNKKSYKVLGFDHCSKDFEIYEFSSDSWRVLDDVLPPGWNARYSGFNVGLKGNTYWLARDGTKPQPNISLLKFDFSTEKSVPVPLPYQCGFFEVANVSAVRDEKLSVLLQRDDTSKTEIWVTNKIDETTQVVTWTKVLALDLSPGLQITRDGSFLLDEEKKVVMICGTWLDTEDGEITNLKYYIYIVGEDNEVTQVCFEVEDEAFGVAILNYVPSLVQIEQAGRKRKRGPDLSNM